jgi:hypothetical protein
MKAKPTSRGQIQAGQVPAPPCASLSTNLVSKTSSREGERNTEWIWILNWTLYLIAIAAMMRILKINYGIGDVRSHFILYFKYYFPREAAVLHLKPNVLHHTMASQQFSRRLGRISRVSRRIIAQNAPMSSPSNPLRIIVVKTCRNSTLEFPRIPKRILDLDCQSCCHCL